MDHSLVKLLLGIGGARLAEGPEATAALLAIAFLAAVIVVAGADADAAPARRAIEGDVRHVDGHFLGEPATLRIAPAWLQVLVRPIDRLHDHLVLLGQNA